MMFVYSELGADVCDSNPCMNGATCMPDLINYHYRCDCPVKYSGTHCETGITCIR